MNSTQAKQIDLNDLLGKLGCAPDREDRGEHWYLSPFREETEASFKITRDGKGWYDHGAGEGGNILEFVIRYYGLGTDDIAGALRVLRGLRLQPGSRAEDASAQRNLWDAAARRAEGGQSKAPSKPKAKRESALQVTDIQPLHNRALRQYLERRGIEAALGERYVQEVHYLWQNKPYFALGFANESGGYELRNPYFQGSHATKDISVLNAGAEGNRSSVALFEGFMDFLSALVHAGQQTPELPVIVLNSASMRHRALAVIRERGFQTVHLYFDHDTTGHMLTGWFQEQLRECAVIDQSGLYDGYKDFNDWLIGQGKERSAAR